MQKTDKAPAVLRWGWRGIYKFNKVMFLKRNESATKLSPCATKKERRRLVQVELERDLESRSKKHEKCIHLYEVC
jgi:hypothetical protein